jgi:hypothetical protein
MALDTRPTWSVLVLVSTALGCARPSPAFAVHVGFHGNQQLSAAQLSAALAHTDASNVDKAVLQVLDAYWSHGFVDVVLGEPRVTRAPDGKVTKVELVVEREGQPYRLSALSLEGELIRPAGELLKMISVSPGQIFDRRAIALGLANIKRTYEDASFANVDVATDAQPDRAAHTVAVKLTIRKGEPSRFGPFQGFLDRSGSETATVRLPPALEARLRALVGITAGAPYQRSSLERAQRALQQIRPDASIQLCLNPDGSYPERVSAYVQLADRLPSRARVARFEPVSALPAAKAIPAAVTADYTRSAKAFWQALDPRAVVRKCVVADRELPEGASIAWWKGACAVEIEDGSCAVFYDGAEDTPLPLRYVAIDRLVSKRIDCATARRL